MSEMLVERVEKAIGDALAEYQAEVICHRGGWIDWAAISRAVIAAIREPTQAMLERGGELYFWHNADYYTGASADEIWRTMIDAALKD